MKNNLYKPLFIFHLTYGWLLIVVTLIFLIKSILIFYMIPLQQNFIFRLLDPIHYFLLVATYGHMYWLVLYGFFNIYVSTLLKERHVNSLYISFTILFLTLIGVIYTTNTPLLG